MSMNMLHSCVALDQSRQLIVRMTSLHNTCHRHSWRGCAYHTILCRPTVDIIDGTSLLTTKLLIFRGHLLTSVFYMKENMGKKTTMCSRPRSKQLLCS